MIDITIILGSLIVFLIVRAWVASFSARLVGSTRGGFRVGLLAVLMIEALAIGVHCAEKFVPEGWGRPRVDLVLFAINLLAGFVVLKKMFRLSFGRTFAPLGACVAIDIGAIVVILGAVRPYVLESFLAPSESMMPTIHPGDRFVVSKILRPRRWDLVAYWSDDKQPIKFCKRVVGLPGEQLRFEGGDLYVDDRCVAAPAVIAGRLHASLASIPRESARYKDGETIMVGWNEYFFIGDNLERSADSRYFGPSKRGAIIGVVDVVYWPLSRLKVLR